MRTRMCLPGLPRRECHSVEGGFASSMVLCIVCCELGELLGGVSSMVFEVWCRVVLGVGC